MNPDPAAGSHLWQIVFVSFAVVVVLFQILRGWRLGLPRQIVRLFALAAAYGTAVSGGRLALPFLRASFRLPDLALSVAAGAIMAMVVYAVINTIGSMLFRPTARHESGLIRLVYGASGALFGLFFGAFLVWLLLLGVRAVGSVADAEVRAQQHGSSSPGAANARRIVNGRLVPAAAPSSQPNSPAELLARLKNSVEIGSLGEALKKADPLPAGSFDTLGKLGQTLADPERAERFLSFPGARELSRHPRMVELGQDPEIARLASEGRYLELLQNQHVIDALNDPSLVDRVKHFDLKGALEQARKED